MSDLKLPTVYARDLEVERPEERWLVRELWGRRAVGVLGGPPKVCKTYLALELAVSVASATPALDRFPVEAPGTALVYLAEDALPQVRSRIEGLCEHRGLEIQHLDLAVITSPSLRLDTLADQDRLAATIHDLRPRLLLLDPLVRLHRREENSATEISALLGYFRDLQRRFDLAVLLVHHTTKKHRSHPGLSLRGSSDIHAFGDSNAYLARRGEDIVLTVEHRSAQAPKPMALELIASPDGRATHLELKGEADRPPEGTKPALEELLLRLLQRRSQPLSRQEIRAQLRVNNQRLGGALRLLESRGQLRHTPSGWTLSPKAQRASTPRGPQPPPGEAS